MLRIGLPLPLWGRWGSNFLLFRDLSLEGVAFSCSFFASTCLMLCGLYSRLASAWSGLSALYIVYKFGHLDGVLPYTHHHTTTLALATFLAAFLPSGGSWSIDRWRAVRRAEREGRPIPPERGPTWGLALLAMLVSSIYFWGAWNKSSIPYLSGLNFQQYLMALYLGSDWPEAPWLPPLMAVLGVSSALLEYVLAVGLWVRRAQPVLIPVAILFHGILYWTMPVATFTATFWLLFVACLDPDAVHRFLDRIGGPAMGEEHSHA
jgi:hypothetical protein